MFNFFKKRFKKEDKNERDKAVQNDVQAMTINHSVSASVQQAGKTYAKPDTYTGNRAVYDSATAKISAKKELFKDGTKVFDPYTKKEIYKTKVDAEAAGGLDAYQNVAETDHIVPLEVIHKEYKNKAFLTNEDIRKAANSDDNLEVISRKINNAKRSKTNEEFVGDEDYLAKTGIELSGEAKQRALRKSYEAKHKMKKELTKSSLKNTIKTGHEAGRLGAKNSGVSTLTISGIRNLTAAIKGEKDVDEALADITIDTGKAAVTGYTVTGGLTVVSHSLSGSSSQFIKALGNANMPGKVVTAVMMTGDSLKRYGNGEISTQELMIELGEKGISTATLGYSMVAGQALIPIPIVGGAIGALVGQTITSKYYNDLMNKLQDKQLAYKERERMIAEAKALEKEANLYREELEHYMAQYFKEYKDCFKEALGDIYQGFESGDADSVVAGANKITKKLGGRVNYNTMDEFEKYMMDDSVDVF